MNKNKKLSKETVKKLLGYSKVATVLLASAQTANAQIVYTDIPDVTGTNLDFNVNFDAAGQNEIRIRVAHTFYNYDILNLGTSVQVVASSPAAVKPLAVNYSINSSNANANVNTWNVLRNFNNQGDKYIGCRFKLADNEWHYGWVLVNFVNYAPCTIKSYAYNTVANEPILAGQTFSVGATPTVETNTGLTLNEGATLAITTAELSATDTDSDVPSLIYTITSSLTNGQLENTDNPGVAIVSFTQQKLIDGKIQ